MVRTRRDGGCVHHQTRNSELGVWDSEFLSVVQSTADGLREACGALWISIPTQTGLSRYSVVVIYDWFYCRVVRMVETRERGKVAGEGGGRVKVATRVAVASMSDWAWL